MSSSHLPGPHGYIIASKMSMFFLLFCWVAQFFSSEKRDKSILIESPVQLLNNSLPLFNNLFVNETNSFQPEPNSYPIIRYFEPNSYPVIREPNSHFQNNSIQVLYETPLKNTSELSILYLLLGLQDSSKNKTIQNNVERNFIIYQIVFVEYYNYFIFLNLLSFNHLIYFLSIFIYITLYKLI